MELDIYIMYHKFEIVSIKAKDVPAGKAIHHNFDLYVRTLSFR